MTRQHTFRILFAVVLLGVIAGCETVPSSGPDALVGQWTNSLGTVWTINPDGTFHVFRRHHYSSGDSPERGGPQKLQRPWRV
jgi:hypothetical protein